MTFKILWALLVLAWAQLPIGANVPSIRFDWHPTGTNLAPFTPTSTAAQTVTYQIQALAWNPDGTVLATAGSSSDGAGIWFYNLNGQLIDQIEAYGKVLSVSWSPDGSKVAARSINAGPDIYQIWDVNTQNVLLRMEALTSSTDYFVYWSPTGDRIATVSKVVAHVWNASTGELISTLESPGSNSDNIRSVAWSPDGAHLYIASGDSVIRVWDVATSTIDETFPISPDLLSMELSPDGTKLAVGTSERQIQIIDAVSGVHQLTLYGSVPAQGGGYATFLKWHPAGTHIASADYNIIRIWDLTQSTPIAEYPQGENVQPEAVDFSINGDFAYIDQQGVAIVKLAADTPTSS